MKSMEDPKCKETLYLIGPSEDPEYQSIFEGKCRFFSSLGYIVINPAPLIQMLPIKRAIKVRLEMLSEADSVFVLSGYEKSDSALLEEMYAKILGLSFAYE